MKKDPCKSTISWIHISTPSYNKYTIKLSEEFMREFFDQIGPISIAHQELSDDFIRDFADKFLDGGWHNLSLCDLSPQILEEFPDKINWDQYIVQAKRLGFTAYHQISSSLKSKIQAQYNLNF